MRFQPQLEVLSDEQIYELHQAALEILWNTGVLVKAPAARDLLRKAGAWVNDETALCRIPGYIVEEALGRAPSSFTVYARNPANDVAVSTRSVHYEPMIGRLNCYDYATGTTHRTTLEDVGHLVKLADALPSYHLLHSGAIMPQIEGVPIRAVYVYTIRDMVEAADDFVVQDQALLADGQCAFHSAWV
ncbi:trimethylamine methyltransferase family protein, partial [Chloroflexota bacterium]